MLLTKNKRLRQFAALLETCNFLSLKLFFKSRYGFRVFPGCVFRTYMNLAKNDHWTSKSIFEICPNVKDTRIVIEHLPGEGINTSIAELAYMALITATRKPKWIFEIGTFRGRTALNFALNSPNDTNILTLDLPPNGRSTLTSSLSTSDVAIVNKSLTGIDYQNKDVTHKIKQLYGDSTTFDFSAYYGKMDMVFIDGAHHYEAVLSDTRNALKMIRPGGCILWHDFANYGDYHDVTRGILDVIPSDRIVQIADTELAVYTESDHN